MFYCVSPYYAFGGIVKDAFIHPAIDGSNPVGTGAQVRLIYYNQCFIVQVAQNVTIGEGNRKVTAKGLWCKKSGDDEHCSLNINNTLSDVRIQRYG